MSYKSLPQYIMLSPKDIDGMCFENKDPLYVLNITFHEIHHTEGHTFLMGINKITFT
jgi:hypothetical protein